jgi:RNA 3'-terminal phosphate cyclase
MLQQFHRFRFGMISLLSLVITIGLTQLVQAQATHLPNTVKNCLPTQTRPSIVRVEHVAQTKLHGRDYYLLTAYPISGYGIDLVISVANNQCNQEFFNPSGDTGSLTQAVGEKVARQLALGRYQQEIRRLGRSKVQQQINRAAVSNGIFYPEDVWALRQLQFSIPRNVRVTQ